MRRSGVLILTAVLAFVAGMLVTGRPAAHAQSTGVTSIVSFENVVESAGVTGTWGWVVRGGNVYRCYRTNPRNPGNTPFECEKQALNFE
jgi:hypothetical protein